LLDSSGINFVALLCTRSSLSMSVFLLGYHSKWDLTNNLYKITKQFREMWAKISFNYTQHRVGFFTFSLTCWCNNSKVIVNSQILAFSTSSRTVLFITYWERLRAPALFLSCSMEVTRPCQKYKREEIRENRKGQAWLVGCFQHNLGNIAPLE